MRLSVSSEPASEACVYSIVATVELMPYEGQKMPRKKIAPESRTGEIKNVLADKLAAELKNSRPYGQPLILEETFRTGKVRVNVHWDAWDAMPLQQRSATILRAYEIAEGQESRNRIALASGLTIAEAYAAGM